MTDGDMSEVLELLASEQGRRDPYPLYEQLRAHPPVYDHRHDAYLVSRYADCKRVLTSKDIGRPDGRYFNGRIPGWRDHRSIVCASRMMNFADKQDHPRLRGLVSEFFTPRKVRQLVEFEAKAVDALLDGLADELGRGEADLQQSLSFRVPSISMAALFGAPEAEVTYIRPLFLAIVNAMEPRLTPQQLADADHAYDELCAYFGELIAMRRRSPRDDLATHIARAHDSGALSTEELIPMFVSLYVAGTMTVSGFIGYGVAALLSNPEEAEKLLKDPSLDDDAANEILRYEAPAQLGRRMALQDTEIGGTMVPAGALIGVLIGAANRDPDVYPEPDAFRIGRAGPAPLSFGGGAYYCIGSALAKLEGAMVFRRLLTRFPTLRISAPPTHNLRSVVRGYLHLPATLETPAAAASSGEERSS